MSMLFNVVGRLVCFTVWVLLCFIPRIEFEQIAPWMPGAAWQTVSSFIWIFTFALITAGFFAVILLGDDQ